MPKCDCTNQRCSCVLTDGDGTTVLGSGSKSDPYRVNIAGGGDGPSFFSGLIAPYAGGSAPTGWLLCNGAAVSRDTYADLFAVCGTVYGPGDGVSTFNLPDLAGRFALGADGDHARGSIAGVEQITLSEANLPPHTHTMAHTHSMSHDHANAVTDSQGNHSHTTNNHNHDIKQSNDDGTNNQTFRRGAQADRNVNTEPANPSTNAAGTHAHNVDIPSFSGSTGGSSASNTGSVGSASPISNMPPYSVVSFIIKT